MAASNVAPNFTPVLVTTCRCEPNYHCPAGSPQQIPCEEGKEAPGYGLAECSDCPAGKISFVCDILGELPT